MPKRDEGFFFGVGVSDVVRILFALAFALSGFYLIFRMLFGPPLFGPQFETGIRTMETKQRLAQPPPAEVNIGISPQNPPPAK